MMPTLLPVAHRAIVLPLRKYAEAATSSDNLARPDTIRRFQGQTRRSPHKRIIDGQQTTGCSM